MRSPSATPTYRPRMAAADDTLLALLGDLQNRFYRSEDQRRFYRDRRALAKALTWPASWLNQRGVCCSQYRYRALLVARLEAIQTHGDSGKYGAFFPAYLLKCLQDWFAWHGEDLYLELKRARHAVEVALLSIGFDGDRLKTPCGDRPEREALEALAGLHRVLVSRKTSGKARPQHHQILLELS